MTIKTITTSVVAALCLAGQSSAPAPLLLAYTSFDNGKTSKWGWIRLNPQITLVKDANGTPTLGLSLPQALIAGPGIIITNTPQGATLSVDASYVAYGSTPPKFPSPCLIQQGSGIWAVDSQYFYFCTPQGKAFRWGRMKFETEW